MFLSRATITGADNSIEQKDLVNLHAKYPFVEWGILFSKAKMSSPRYPSFTWLQKLAQVKKEHPELCLSAHICGRWVRDICEGKWTILQDLPFMDIFERYQLNFHSYIHKIEKELGADRVAAIVLEPIQGEGGFVVPPQGFIKGLSEFCTKNGIVFIADEVQTGFARTGSMFACDDEGVVPDLMTTAKGIAGGLPLAAVTGRADIMDSIHVGGLGGTYGGSPVACAAALGAIATIEEEKLVDRANHLGSIMSDALHAMKKKYSIVGDVRGRGAMQAIELVQAGSDEPNSAALASIVKYCQQKGVLILSAGTYGNVIRLLPPLVMPDHLLKEALAILDEAVAQAR